MKELAIERDQKNAQLIEDVSKVLGKTHRIELVGSVLEKTHEEKARG